MACLRMRFEHLARDLSVTRLVSTDQPKLVATKHWYQTKKQQESTN